VCDQIKIAEARCKNSCGIAVVSVDVDIRTMLEEEIDVPTSRLTHGDEEKGVVLRSNEIGIAFVLQ
jgi:hypothetical protein